MHFLYLQDTESEWGTFQTLAHDNPSLQTIQRWILSFQWRDSQTQIQMLSASKVPPLSTFLYLQFPGVINTFENPTKPVWPLPPPPPLHPKDALMLFRGNIFNQGVVHHTPLKRGSKSSRNRSLLGAPESQESPESGRGEPAEVGWKLQLNGISVR